METARFPGPSAYAENHSAIKSGENPTLVYSSLYLQSEKVLLLLHAARIACLMLAIILFAPTAWADSVAPDAPTVTPVAVEPTSPAMTEPTVAATAPPEIDSSPIDVAPEHAQPTAVVSEPNVPPTVAPGVYSKPESGPQVPGVTLNPRVPVQPAPTQATVSSAPPAAIDVPPQVVNPSPPPDDSSITQPYSSVSAASPSELTCRGKSHPSSLPFLVAPFSGWTEVVSFLDHDSPDYSVDGKIVIANGITATAGDGQESDEFPAYWAPSLRQFVNYDGHNGYDFGLVYQPVLAAAAGTIRFAGWNSSDPYAGYGQMVLIQHEDGYVTLYGHLSRIEVKQGQKVEAGEEIGISGTTGNSSGPHLHFSVFHDCNVVDPYGWTGQGTDPLQTFDAEHETYLWLPGHDPLLVNPPRGWPTFPLGLKLPSDLATHVGSHSRSAAVPPVDRLLLLDLPESHSVGASTPAVALARTEASITREAEAIAPSLDELRSQGLIQRFEVIPAAAAVWLRGTATASQLLNLPGVASLAGVRPRDLSAAQDELSHAVLIQIAHQVAPSLWPVGFRSALHAWRPEVTLVDNHALVTGMVLPGQSVALTLSRGGDIVGVAEATSDSDSGGFVAMLHDVAGNPVRTQPGDLLTLRSTGKTASMRVLQFELKARSSEVEGMTEAGASIPVTMTRVGAAANDTTVTVSSAKGRFRLAGRTGAQKSFLPVGELVVATISDAAGDQEAASAFVPGVHLTIGSPLVSGWTVGNAPRVTLIRAGKILVSRRIRPAPDGTFQIALRSRGKSIPLSGGDVVRVGSIWHPRTVNVPRVRLELDPGSPNIEAYAPAGESMSLTLNRKIGATVVGRLRSDSHGVAHFSLPDAPVTLGDEGQLTIVTPSGDEVIALGQTRGILVREGSSEVSGTVHPGAVISMHVLDRGGVELGRTVATADSSTGKFASAFHDLTGKPLEVLPGMQLIIHDGSLQSSTSIPPLQLSMKGTTLTSEANTTSRKTATWSTIDASGQVSTRALRANHRGVIRDQYDVSGLATRIRGVTLSIPAGAGITVERTLDLTLKHPALPHPTAGKTTERCSGKVSGPGSKREKGTACADVGE